MAQELGRIDRPSVDQYQGRRKLLLVPLVYAPQSDIQEGAAALQNYWEQMQTQVAAMETALGGLQHIYHESLTVASRSQQTIGNIEGIYETGTSCLQIETAHIAKTKLVLKTTGGGWKSHVGRDGRDDHQVDLLGGNPSVSQSISGG